MGRKSSAPSASATPLVAARVRWFALTAWDRALVQFGTVSQGSSFTSQTATMSPPASRLACAGDGQTAQVKILSFFGRKSHMNSFM